MLFPGPFFFKNKAILKNVYLNHFPDLSKIISYDLKSHIPDIWISTI